MRWAETILAAKGISSAAKVSAACFMVGQSDWLPMMMATLAMENVLPGRWPGVGPKGSGGL